MDRFLEVPYRFENNLFFAAGDPKKLMYFLKVFEKLTGIEIDFKDDERIAWLESWYVGRVDGGWEGDHYLSFTIISGKECTLQIDIEDTEIEGATLEKQIFGERNSGLGWCEFESNGKLFIGKGDSNKLLDLIEHFRKFWTENIRSDEA